MLNQLTQPQPHGAGYDVAQAMEAFLSRFGKFKTNDEFLASLTKDGI
jgi:hypothetical protein